MSDPRPTNPFSTSAVPGAVPAEVGAPPAIQVDARTQQAFLTQAFVWMFAGLLLTAPGIPQLFMGQESSLKTNSGATTRTTG